MLNITKLGLLSLVLLAGCTREVYLQPVSCNGDCQKKEEVVAPVVVPTCVTPCVNMLSCCQVTETQVIKYQVYEAPAPKVTIQPIDNGFRRCRQSCHKVQK